MFYSTLYTITPNGAFKRGVAPLSTFPLPLIEGEGEKGDRVTIF
jgi:hypothetical protein